MSQNFEEKYLDEYESRIQMSQELNEMQIELNTIKENLKNLQNTLFHKTPEVAINFENITFTLIDWSYLSQFLKENSTSMDI